MSAPEDSRPPRKPIDLAQLRGELDALLSDPASVPESDLLLQMLSTVTKCVRDGIGRGDVKVLNSMLKEARYAFKVFAPYRRVRKVSIFGSARTPLGSPEYVQAEAFANRITQEGWMVITGAGGGIMEAAQGGAGRVRSFGVNIRLPFEQKANPIIADDSKLITFKYFFTRKLAFVKETDAIALFPGGFGTHDEGYEALTLVQTGKSELLPIVFIDRPGGTYWKEWKAYVDQHLVRCHYIDEDDLNLFTVTDSVEEAVKVIHRFYSSYHSMRYVGPRLVLRLKQPVGDALLEELHEEFGRVATDGRIERVGIQPEEENEPETHHLHRLALMFNRRQIGQLRRLVDRINLAGKDEDP